MKKIKHDWKEADALTDAEIRAAALSDPDAQPLTRERLANMRPVPRKIITTGARPFAGGIRRPLPYSHEQAARLR
jgi:hypothetical protein